jgi:hypothetical protein
METKEGLLIRRGLGYAIRKQFGIQEMKEEREPDVLAELWEGRKKVGREGE